MNNAKNISGKNLICTKYHLWRISCIISFLKVFVLQVMESTNITMATKTVTYTQLKHTHYIHMLMACKSNTTDIHTHKHTHPSWTSVHIHTNEYFKVNISYFSWLSMFLSTCLSVYVSHLCRCMSACVCVGVRENACYYCGNDFASV